MSLPFEELISTAVEQISSGVQLKISQIEEQRNRDFTHQMKELEFYKSNYEKDLKEIFNYWFELVRLVHIKDNKNLTKNEQEKMTKKYNDLLNVSKVSKYKMDTLKYGGKETGRILALESCLHNKKYANQPEQVTIYIWCTVLAVLKKDILGQDTDAMDIIRVLVNDLYDDDNFELIQKSKKYVVNAYKEIYGEEPYWR